MPRDKSLYMTGSPCPASELNTGHWLPWLQTFSLSATLRHVSCSIASIFHCHASSVALCIRLILAPFFIPSTSLCSLSSWLTSSYVYHHHRYPLRSHHLSLPRPFTPDLKLISFTNPFLHSHSYSFRTDFTDLNLYRIKGALALFVLVSFSGYVC